MTVMHMTKNVGKPYEGKPHVRFDEGKEGKSPLTYSTQLKYRKDN